MLEQVCETGAQFLSVTGPWPDSAEAFPEQGLRQEAAQNHGELFDYQRVEWRTSHPS